MVVVVSDVVAFEGLAGRVMESAVGTGPVVELEALTPEEMPVRWKI